MKKYYINHELSKEIYDRNKGIIEIKCCYLNVAKIVIHDLLNKEEFKDAKVVFGGWKINLGETSNSMEVYAKHCFLLLNDEVIDVTAFKTEIKEDVDYIIFKTFTMDEYLEHLEDCDGDTSLSDMMLRFMNQKSVELYKENIILLG